MKMKWRSSENERKVFNSQLHEFETEKESS